MSPSPNIIFSHANGFPPSCYRAFKEKLINQYCWEEVDSYGLHQTYPVNSNWQNFVQQLMASLQDPDRTYTGIGHSLGGVVTLMAALRYPSRFNKIILLDSPIFGPPKAWLIKLFKQLGLFKFFTPSTRVKKRKNYWESLEEARTYFVNRDLFRDFSKESLQDYLDAALIKDETGYRLKIPPNVEASIYTHMPTKFKFQGKVSIPCYYLVGRKSTLITSAEKKFITKRFCATLIEVEGGHLFPFEYPQQTAAVIESLLAS